MNFQLVFENSGDVLAFKAVHNIDLLNYFVTHANSMNTNLFSDNGRVHRQVQMLLTEIHWAVSKTNEVLYDLIGYSFSQNTDLEDYLNQNFLNKQHSDWVRSQKKIIDIDVLRSSSIATVAKLGNKLHDIYPDEVRQDRLCSILDKLGYVYPYEEVNMTVHRLESAFNKIEYSSDLKWQIFNNPHLDNMYSANDVANFSFNYTYVGRQNYDKFVNFDHELAFDDFYNFEDLEFSFQLSLENPQTIPFSQEFLDWSRKKNIKPITYKLPIANIENLSEKLFDYRKILFRNSLAGNSLKIII